MVFDDAIKDDDANEYVQRLFSVMEDADLWIDDPIETWYVQKGWLMWGVKVDVGCVFMKYMHAHTTWEVKAKYN